MATTLGISNRRAASALAFVLLVGIAVSGVPSATTTPAPLIDPALTKAVTGTVDIIVQARNADAAAAIVQGAGGSITTDLSIIDGFAATIPPEALRELARSAAIRTITLDRAVRLLDDGGSTNPPSVYPAVTGIDAVRSAGYKGKGVTIAVVDTGIADMPHFGDRVLTVADPNTGDPAACANFSGEAGCADSYGHGTFIAGILAGNGAGSGGRWTGVAPKANLVSVKLAGRNGAADVSTLLAAIQWIVSFKDDYGIRVMTLSLGTDSPQPYLLDPLNYAVERAWNAGIVVVVAASNRGPGPATVTKPADDPWVITVGAIDDRGTVDTADDLVPDFSARGPTLSDSLAKPDLVAPGAHIVSLVAPGSLVEENFPATIDGSYRQGSGTSFAAPVVGGTAALLLERDPSLTPNQIKYALMNSTQPTTSDDQFAVGRGLLDAEAAVLATPAGQANQDLLQGDGLGLLQDSRGTLLFTADDVEATLIQGLYTQQLQLWDQLEYTTMEWTGASWYGASWYGASWYGASWYGASWYGASWYGASWYGASWYEDDGSDPSYGSGLLGDMIYGAWE